MNKRLILPIAIGATVLGIGGAIVPAATAAPPAASQQTDATAKGGCTVNSPTMHAITNTKIRKTKSIKSPGKRLWYKNTNGCASGSSVEGGTHKRCGDKNSYNLWRKVKYRGTTGWVPMPCLHSGPS